MLAIRVGLWQPWVFDAAQVRLGGIGCGWGHSARPRDRVLGLGCADGVGPGGCLILRRRCVSL